MDNDASSLTGQASFSPGAIPANAGALPGDLAACHAMIAELVAAYAKEKALSEKLQHQLEQLLRQRYGRKAEGIDWAGSLFPKEVLDALIAQAQAPQTAAIKETISYERDKPAPCVHGRQALPDRLPRVREVVDVPEEEKKCSVCDADKIMIREEVSEQLEYVPASLYVKQTVRPVYACPQEHEISIAPAPSNPINKGLAGPGLLAQVAVSKYGDHLPLNRQEDIFSRNGVELARSTQCDWMRQCAELLQPLYRRMKDLVLQAKVVNTDDTPVAVQEKKETRKGRAWVYLDARRQLAVFDYTQDRKRDGPRRFLGDFAGYLQADAYAGYDCIFATKQVHEVACWAHARRKFHDAQTAQPEGSLCALARIKQLYDPEREAKEWRDSLDAGLPEAERWQLFSEKRLALRQEKSKAAMAGFDRWLAERTPHILPKSPLGQAIQYARSNWQALQRYLDDGDLEIDNNSAERAMRHVAVGRKNWLFFGSDRGGRTWATLTSLIYSAKLHELNLFAYMRGIFARIAGTRITDLDQFLPDVWKRNRAKGEGNLPVD